GRYLARSRGAPRTPDHAGELTPSSLNQLSKSRWSDGRAASDPQHLKDLRPLAQGGDRHHIVGRRLGEHPLERLDFVGKHRGFRLPTVLEPSPQVVDEVVWIAPTKIAVELRDGGPVGAAAGGVGEPVQDGVGPIARAAKRQKDAGRAR